MTQEFKVGDVVRIPDGTNIDGWYTGYRPKVRAQHGDVGIVVDTRYGSVEVQWFRTGAVTGNWHEFNGLEILTTGG